jgi:beta-lactam-binding protein with PASTA domain
VTSDLRGAGFEVFVDYDNKVDSTCKENDAVGTSPDGRTIKGGVVTIEVSNGKGAKKPEGPDQANADVGPGRPTRPRTPR